MAVQGATQGLLGAFAFGMAVVAAQAGLVLFIKGHASSLFRDSLRLVLVTFLLSAALWAKSGFAALLMRSDLSTPCQVSVIVATAFDQMARFTIEQYLVWAIRSGSNMSAGQLIPQLLVWVRIVMGAVFVGLTRPQMDTFCVAMSSWAPLAVATVVFDGLILVVVIGRCFATGVVGDVRHGKTDSARSASLLLVVLGFAVWTGTSVKMLLGTTDTAIVLRTAVPAFGLLVLILTLLVGVSSLPTPRSPRSSIPEAPSPRIRLARNATADSTDYPPSRYEEIKDAAIRSSTAFTNPRVAPRAHEPGGNEPRGVTKKTRVSAISAIEGALFPSSTSAPSMPARSKQSEAKVKAFFGKGATNVAVGVRPIGRPILQDVDGTNPLRKMATVDLQTANEMERLRRAKRLRELREQEEARGAAKVADVTAAEAMKRVVSLQRKEVASRDLSAKLGSDDTNANAISSSAQLSPGAQDVRRRSPSMPQPLKSAPVQTVAATSAASLHRLAAPPPTVPKELSLPEGRAELACPTPTRRPAASTSNQTILFLHDIMYDDPSTVQDIIDGAHGKARNTVGSPSMVHRPRPIPRREADPPWVPTHNEVISQRGRWRTRSTSSLPVSAPGPGSPSRLPPLPPLPPPRSPLPPAPKSAGAVPDRRFPNDTKSMTFQEKMTLLFPTPPSPASAGKNNSQFDSLLVPPVPPLRYQSFMHFGPSPTNSSQARTSTMTETVFDADEDLTPRNDRRRASSAVIPTGLSSTEMVTVMLSPSISTDSSRDSSRQASGEWPVPGQWHRRVGDSCPTFSDRKEKRSRKMAPPTPLVLAGQVGTKAKVVVQEELSPVESPSHALKVIQAQLMRFEEVAGVPSVMPTPTRRTAMLEDLEKEMGDQEEHWRGMQNKLMGRESVSLALASSPRQKLALEHKEEEHAAETTPATRPKLLWRPRPVPDPQPAPSLWQPTHEEHDDFEQLTSHVFTRAFSRRDAGALTISSSHMWRKPHKGPHLLSCPVLWRPSWTCTAPPAEPVKRTSKPVESGRVRVIARDWEREREREREKERERERQRPPRPLTLRPPRRSRRISSLPDIVESPEPLPDRRDTLGIFQFPWGERSDMASAQQPPRAMPGTMASRGFHARSRQSPAANDYSCSFFDDYENGSDYEEGTEESDENEEGEDSDFDESTLWEIASLLKTTEGVPSKTSMFPPPLPLLEADEEDDRDHKDEEDNRDDDEEEEGQQNDTRTSREESILISFNATSPLALPVQETLWESPVDKSPLWGHDAAQHAAPQPLDRAGEVAMESTTPLVRETGRDDERDGEDKRDAPLHITTLPPVDESRFWSPSLSNRADEREDGLTPDVSRTLESTALSSGYKHGEKPWRPQVAYAADWDAALEEALAASGYVGEKKSEGSGFFDSDRDDSDDDNDDDDASSTTEDVAIQDELPASGYVRAEPRSSGFLDDESDDDDDDDDIDDDKDNVASSTVDNVALKEEIAAGSEYVRDDDASSTAEDCPLEEALTASAYMKVSGYVGAELESPDSTASHEHATAAQTASVGSLTSPATQHDDDDSSTDAASSTSGDLSPFGAYMDTTEQDNIEHEPLLDTDTRLSSFTDASEAGRQLREDDDDSDEEGVVGEFPFAFPTARGDVPALR